MQDNQFQQNQKLWGISQHLFVGANTDLAIAYGKAGGASSLHYHKYKHNNYGSLHWGRKRTKPSHQLRQPLNYRSDNRQQNCAKLSR